MAAWASSRKPARRSIIATPASPPIYEGTNGIQSIDLVHAQARGQRAARSVWALLDELSGDRQAKSKQSNDPAFGTAELNCARRWARLDSCQRDGFWSA